MKKILLSLMLMGICLSVFAQQAVIREVSGTVEVKASGASSYVAANSGDRVAEDTIVSTGFKSSALVEVGSAHIVIRPLTRLTLNDVRTMADAETLNVNLQAGRVRVDLKPPAGTKASLTVSSPSATASVRGTVFEMDTRRLFVIDGRVGYRGGNGNLVNVNAGYDSTVLADGTSTSPYGNKQTGFQPSTIQPSAPVGYEATSVPSTPSSGPQELSVPDQAPNVPPPPSQPPSNPGGNPPPDNGGVTIEPDF